MVRVIFDEDFNGYIIHGVRTCLPGLDAVRVVDLFKGAPDPHVLQFAFDAQRVLVTHDVNTMTEHLRDRGADGLPVPGVIFVHQSRPIGPVIRSLYDRLGHANDPAEFDPPVWL